MSIKLTKYETAQLKKIKSWKNEEPGVIDKAFGVVIEPVAWLVKQVVPDAAVRGALDLSNAMAEWLTDISDVLRDGKVEKIEDLRSKDLELSDTIANVIHNWAIGFAVLEGAGAGVFGILGAPVDVPAIITLALRTIHKIGVCYGFECNSEMDKKFALSVMAASSANTMDEKMAALATLKTTEVLISKVAWKKMTAIAAEKQLSKEGAVIAIKNLAKQLGINITKRRALASIPVIGAAIGGSVNGWYIKEVGWAARRAFQERWLYENGKIVDA